MTGKDKQQGGGENFASKPEKAGEAGKKGGQHQQKQGDDSDAGGQQRGGPQG